MWIASRVPTIGCGVFTVDWSMLTSDDKPGIHWIDVAIRHEVRMRTSLSKLCECLSTESGIGSWWDKPTAVRIGGDLFWEFRPGPGHGVLRMKVFPPVPK